MEDKKFTLKEIQSKSKVVPLFELETISMENVIPKIQPWLWEGYIPLQTCTLFAGSGGLGKSQLLLHIAAIVSRGINFSINSLSFSVPQGNILLLSAEDDEEYTIVPRLIAADADLAKIHLIKSAVQLSDRSKDRFVRLDQDILLLQDKLQSMGNVKLIIIDPITAYIGNLKENHSSEVRNFILKLNKLAKDNDLAIILNTHLRKKSGEGISSAADEILGSIAWSSTVRSAFAIARHPDDESTILFMSSKSNYKKSEAFGYKIVSKIIQHANQDIETSAIEWLNQKIDISADEAVDKKLYETRTRYKACQDLIVETLTPNGTYLYKLLKVTADEGFAERTFYEAARKLNIIKSRSYGEEKKMYWALSSNEKF